MITIYQHSGGLGRSRGRFATVTVPLMVVLAALYAWLQIVMPWPLAHLFGLLLFGCLTGLLIGVAASIAKCRNERAMRVYGLLGGAVTVYVAWVVFALILANRLNPQMPVGLLQCGDPRFLWAFMQELSRTGWNAHDSRGMQALLEWAGEAAGLIVLPLLVAPLAIADELFCESCGAWCKVAETRFAPISPEQPELLRPITEIQPVEVVGLATQEAQSLPCFRMQLLKCPTCDCQGLRVVRLREEIDGKGRKSTATDAMPGVMVIG